MRCSLHLHHKAASLVQMGVPLSVISETGLADKLIKMKYDIPNDRPELFDQYYQDIDEALAKISS